jgi:aminopeptidase YwaD
MRNLALAAALGVALFSPTPARAENSAAITGDEIQRHVGYLASDELEGRGTATKGERLAGAYLAENFKTYGLTPGAADGSFFQPFEVTGRQSLDGKPSLRIDVGTWYRDLKIGADFNAFGFSGDLDGKPVNLVFAGYGITDPEKGYDDYAGIDVRGKAVLVLRHEPNETGRLGRGSLFTTKAENAKAHGAVAMLVVTDPRHHPDDESLLPFGGGADAGIAAVHVRLSLALGLLKLAHKDLLSIQKTIDSTGKPNSFEVGASVGLSLKINRKTATARNVVAVIPGTDPKLKDEIVVIGAHYDHLGRGHMGGSLQPQAAGTIHNGADDNASGTAGLLELAQAFAAAPAKRTLYFVGFSGEERGLLGSQHFVKDPPVARERIVAMVNLDMIGHLTDNSVEVGGAGTAPGFAELATQATEAQGLKVKLSKTGYGPSDHASFYGAKIPVLFFFTGLHADYHKPTDDADKLNSAGAERVARAAYACAREIADAAKRPEYIAIARQRGRRGPRGPRIGVMPAMGDAGPGVAIQEVIEGGPAHKAGLQDGDVLIKLDGKTLIDLQDLRKVLGSQKSGNTVKAVILRGTKELELEITLG